MTKLGRGWAQPFIPIIKAIPEGIGPTTLRTEDWPPPECPVINAWDNIEGMVTLTGDSGLRMTMDQGQAFNHGLRDVQVLIGQLEPLYKDESIFTAKVRKATIDAHEAEMCERNCPAVFGSRRACLNAHEQEKIREKSPILARSAIRQCELES